MGERESLSGVRVCVCVCVLLMGGEGRCTQGNSKCYLIGCIKLFSPPSTNMLIRKQPWDHQSIPPSVHPSPDRLRLSRLRLGLYAQMVNASSSSLPASECRVLPTQQDWLY
ncbi:hypothetical protein B0T10DRAFT_479471 [Thelonectria olida]|uniref:Secreted protein n=1 Tax=Thelonectria olida TaxID=1576542 RepID=A0A9P8WA76_9HYPO|nr:hypothetical protein B0T10DRAFT_479471 [Thelonectria olida]